MKRYAWMIVNPKGNPVVLQATLPIYWLKQVAEQDARERAGGAKVVRISLESLMEAAE